MKIKEPAKFESMAKKLSHNLKDELRNSKAAQDKVAKELMRDYQSNIVLAEALKENYWNNEVLNEGLSGKLVMPPKTNPHDRYGGLDIVVTFGERDYSANIFGTTAFRIKNVYFTGRSLPIALSEDVIIEEHSFFARNIERFDPPPIIQESTVSPTDSSKALPEPVTIVEPTRNYGTIEQFYANQPLPK